MKDKLNAHFTKLGCDFCPEDVRDLFISELEQELADHVDRVIAKVTFKRVMKKIQAAKDLTSTRKKRGTQKKKMAEVTAA